MAYQLDAAQTNRNKQQINKSSTPNVVRQEPVKHLLKSMKNVFFISAN